MRNVYVKRRWTVRMGDDPASVVTIEPGEQSLEDSIADRAIRAGVAEAKRGRPKSSSKKATAATAPPETTAIGPGETETKR